jgi:hypothetical protein
MSWHAHRRGEERAARTAATDEQAVHIIQAWHRRQTGAKSAKSSEETCRRRATAAVKFPGGDAQIGGSRLAY